MGGGILRGMPEPVERALQRLLAAASPLEAEPVPCTAAAGRVSAEEVHAARAAPGFARAAMDGYVCHDEDVRTASAQAPVRLLVTGEARPGKPPGAGPARGEAWVTSTGAAMPLRGDRVLPLEWVRREGGTVVVSKPVPVKRHVMASEEELAEGAALLRPGEAVTPGAVAALVAGGVREVRVHRRPRVVLFCTGDELVEPPAPAPPGRTVNTNAFALAAELTRAGCEVDYGGLVPDRPEALRARFRAALAGPYDVVLTTGGVSVGRHDRVPRAWLDLGAQRVAGRVDLKPGGPFFAAQVGGRWAVGLSGSPAACMAAYHLLVRPLLLRLGGRRHVVRPVVLARLRGWLPATDRPRALWARLEFDADRPEVEPIGGGVLEGPARAHALVLLPGPTPPLRAGSLVATLFLAHEECSESLTIPEPQPAPLVVGVVGESGAGKTAVVEGLVARLHATGRAVGVVKHAPHGFEVDRPGSDSDRAVRAGACWVGLVDGEVVWRSQAAERRGEPAVRAFVEAARAFGALPEVVLVEGLHHPAERTILVGPPKEPGPRPWCELPAVNRVPRGSWEALLDGLTARIVALLETGE